MLQTDHTHAYTRIHTQTHTTPLTSKLTLSELKRFLTSERPVLRSPSLCLRSVERRVFILFRITASCFLGNTHVPRKSLLSSIPLASEQVSTAVYNHGDSNEGRNKCERLNPTKNLLPLATNMKC